MLTLDVIALFFPLCILLALTPGPDNIFVLTQSALNGKLAGILVVLGLCTGVLVHTTAVALGVAAIFKASPTAFNVLKIIGALYLLYLAWGAFRAKTENITVTQLEEMYALSNSYEALFNKRAKLYKAMDLKNQVLSETDYRQYLLDEYTFLKRPVFIVDEEIFIGNSKKVVEKLKEKIG